MSKRLCEWITLVAMNVTELQVQLSHIHCVSLSGFLFGFLCMTHLIHGGMMQVQWNVLNTFKQDKDTCLADLLDIMKHEVS